MLQPRPAIALLVLLAFSGVGKAQTSVSASSGGLAHDCFIAALRSTQTGARSRTASRDAAPRWPVP
jgi:hypothetical protein